MAKTAAGRERQLNLTQSAKAPPAGSLMRSQKGPEDVAPEPLLFSGAYRGPAQRQASELASATRAYVVPESTPFPKLGTNDQPILRADRAAWPGSGSDNGSVYSLIAGPPDNARALEQETLKTVSPDQWQPRSVTTVSSSKAAVEPENADTQAEAGTHEASTEAFRLHLRPTINFTGDPNLGPTDKEMAANAELVRSGQFQQTANEDQVRDLSTLGVVGNAFRDQKPFTNRTPETVDGTTGKSGPTMREAPAPIERSNPARFEQDRQGDGSAANASSYLEVLRRTSGQETVFTSAAPRATTPNSEAPGSTRPVQLPALITGARLNPANQMTVRLEGGSGQVISVRFLNQGGQVEVAVRSSDAGAASQLRQELTSLTSNLDRIGWKTDLTGTPGHETLALHELSGSGRNSPENHKGSNLDWEEDPPKKRPPTAEFWDELRHGQDT